MYRKTYQLAHGSEPPQNVAYVRRLNITLVHAQSVKVLFSSYNIIQGWLIYLLFSNNKIRPGEMPAPSCLEVKRGLFRFGPAPSGKAPGAAPLAAFSRYKDLPRSLFSYYLPHLSFTSLNDLLGSFLYCKSL